MDRPMIVAEGLEKHFGTTHALQGLDLDGILTVFFPAGVWLYRRRTSQ